MTLPEALKIFDLKIDKDVLWGNEAVKIVPDYLSDNIGRINEVVADLHRSNEAFARILIDQILLAAIYEQRHDPLETRITSDAQGPAILTLTHELLMTYVVTHNDTKMMLNGTADYTILYDTNSTSKLATNLILVEAKKAGMVESCLGQLTAYMGIVHRTRQNEEKRNSVVYGAASDGNSFRFLRIDNESKWTQSQFYQWDWHGSDMIYTIIHKLIRIAALSSPSTSPIKSSKAKGKVLADFESPRSQHYDFAFEELSILEMDPETQLGP